MSKVDALFVHKSQSKFTLAQLIAYSAAILLAIASAITNVSSAVSKHTSLSGQFIAGSIALAVALLVLIALPAAISAAKARQFAAAAVAALVFTLAASYSVTSALGVLGKPRLEAGMHANHDADTRKNLTEKRQRALDELATLAPARPASELNSLIAAKLATPGANGCNKVSGPVSMKVCAEVSHLQEESSRYNRISALTGTVAHADGELAKLGKPTIANSDAAALVAVLATFGLTINADAMNVALMLLAVMILEVGSGLALAVAQSMRVAVPAMRDITPAIAEPVANVPAVVERPALRVVPNTEAAKAAERIRELAAQSNGKPVASSKRALAKLIDVSPATACRAIALLGAAGAALIANDKIAA